MTSCTKNFHKNLNFIDQCVFHTTGHICHQTFKPKNNPSQPFCLTKTSGFSDISSFCICQRCEHGEEGARKGTIKAENLLAEFAEVNKLDIVDIYYKLEPSRSFLIDPNTLPETNVAPENRPPQ